MKRKPQQSDCYMKLNSLFELAKASGTPLTSKLSLSWTLNSNPPNNRVLKQVALPSVLSEGRGFGERSGKLY